MGRGLVHRRCWVFAHIVHGFSLCRLGWGGVGVWCAVVIAGGSHPVSFRTRSLSLFAPMVLPSWWGWVSRLLPHFFLGGPVLAGPPFFLFCVGGLWGVGRCAGARWDVQRIRTRGDRMGPPGGSRGFLGF